MGGLILALLPLAAAMAVNPVPIIGVIAMLSTDKPLRNGAMYVATMVVVVAGIGVFSLLVLNKALGAAGSSGSSGGLQLLMGLSFLSIAFLQWRAKPAPGSAPREPGWMKMMDKGGPFVAVVLGLALVNYALVAGATSDILKAKLSVAAGLAAIAVFTVLSLSTEWGPYVAFIFDRPRSEQFMVRVRKSLIAHNRVILLWVFVAMGVLYVVKGLIPLL
jgi:hypothetical protein